MWSVATALVDIARLEMGTAYWTAIGTPEPLCAQSQQHSVIVSQECEGNAREDTAGTTAGHARSSEQESLCPGAAGPADPSSASHQGCGHLENSFSPYVTDPRDLSSAVVLLSGATDANGMGLRMAAAFERAGARVVLVGRRTHEEAVACSRESAAATGVLARSVYIQADLVEEKIVWCGCGCRVAKARDHQIGYCDTPRGGGTCRCTWHRPGANHSRHGWRYVACTNHAHTRAASVFHTWGGACCVCEFRGKHDSNTQFCVVHCVQGWC